MTEIGDHIDVPRGGDAINHCVPVVLVVQPDRLADAVRPGELIGTGDEGSRGIPAGFVHV
jgi:hypothetical protein